MSNAELAALLFEMSELLEIEGANPFRVRAYQRAALAVREEPRPVERLSPEELREIPGVGRNIAEHIAACRSGGLFPELAALRARLPPGLLELTRVPGLGPKRARRLFEEAAVSSPARLREALARGELRGLPGFGPRLLGNLARELSKPREPSRLLLPEARRLAESLLSELRALPGVARAEAAGSLRRGRETVGDIDLLACSEDPGAVVSRFTRLAAVERVLGSGTTKATVRLGGGALCDLRVVPQASFGAALLYFTGSKAHNVRLRGLALKKRLTLNEYGLFRLSDKGRGKPLAGRTEAQVYAALGLGYVEPELREDRGELEAAAAGRLPRLVTLADIRGDFHNHSTHSDGRQTLEEMARAARELGYEWAALGDHSQSLHVTHGLDPARLRASFRELERVRREVPGIRLMRSMEVDILKEGALDYEDELLDEIDVVVASVHSRFQQPEAQMTERLVRAASNRKADIIGHLSGRVIGRRPAYAFDAERVLEAAAEAGTAVEINGQPDRQDADDLRARRARELGAPLALGSDAHSARELAYMENAVLIARRAWLQPGDVLNCKSYGELREWLDARG